MAVQQAGSVGRTFRDAIFLQVLLGRRPGQAVQDSACRAEIFAKKMILNASFSTKEVRRQ